MTIKGQTVVHASRFGLTLKYKADMIALTGHIMRHNVGLSSQGTRKRKEETKDNMVSQHHGHIMDLERVRY